MRMIFIEIIVFCALAMVLTSCATALKDISFSASVDIQKDDVRQELEIEGTL